MLAFHGARAGEKMEGIGRHAVVAAHEVIAEIPSWFLDAERACPATTYYVSAQAHGPLRAITSQERKARVLAALMTKYQPEGRHVPISANHPLYRKAIRTSMGAVLRVPFARVGDWREAIVTLRERGVTVVALTPAPTASPLDAFDPAALAAARVLLIAGSEGSGLSADVLNGADRQISIPMAEGTDSLNVTVAAGIALWRLACSR